MRVPACVRKSNQYRYMPTNCVERSLSRIDSKAQIVIWYPLHFIKINWNSPILYNTANFGISPNFFSALLEMLVVCLFSSDSSGHPQREAKQNNNSFNVCCAQQKMRKKEKNRKNEIKRATSWVHNGWWISLQSA